MIKKAELVKALSLAQVQLLEANLKLKERDNLIKLADNQIGNMIFNIGQGRVVTQPELLRCLEYLAETLKLE